MRPDLIVVLPPSIDLHCGILQVQEPVLVETFYSKATVERFDKCIVRGLSRSGEVQDDSVRISPKIEFFGDELTPVVYRILCGQPNSAIARFRVSTTSLARA